jgi:hypothetical protein
LLVIVAQLGNLNPARCVVSMDSDKVIHVAVLGRLGQIGALMFPEVEPEVVPVVVDFEVAVPRSGPVF